MASAPRSETSDRVPASSIGASYWVADEGKVGVSSLPWRYLWPSELDLMASLAGMTMWERWTREAFSSDSTAQVSVWQQR
jgi:hypothetical protein